MKGCPLLIQSDTEPSLLRGGESHTRTYMLTCIGEKCAAYEQQSEFCNRFQSTVGENLMEQRREDREEEVSE